jgi:hypothetical protein
MVPVNSQIQALHGPSALPTCHSVQCQCLKSFFNFAAYLLYFQVFALMSAVSCLIGCNNMGEQELQHLTWSMQDGWKNSIGR